MPYVAGVARVARVARDVIVNSSETCLVETGCEDWREKKQSRAMIT